MTSLVSAPMNAPGTRVLRSARRPGVWGCVAMATDEVARRGRINDAGCQWDVSLVQVDLESLRTTDRGAWAKFVALMVDAEQYGLTFDVHGRDYSAPVGDRIKPIEFRGKPMPWLGELRVEERTPQRPSPLGDAVHHRLYFGEPDHPSNLILGLSMGHKRGRDRDASRKQTRQMIDAMWKLIHWRESRTPKTGWRSWIPKGNVDL